ncbi:MAG: hypothetical protein D6797_00975 [Bdellovibrio sp.]|nr:MAG: hypothetical protein D6797_00975 [Bdellovibrio sp.]
MVFQFQVFDSWEKASQRAKAIYSIENHVQVYSSVPQALLESTQSLYRSFSHKKKVLYLKDQEPYISLAVTELVKQGVKAIPLTADEINQHEFKEVLAIIYATDVPLIGKRLDLSFLEQEELQKFVKIEVSYASHFYEDEPFVVDEQNQIKIFSLSGFTLLVHGSRPRVRPLVTPFEFFGDLDFTKDVVKKKEQHKELIESFEQKRPGGFQPLFGSTDQRWYDRSVFYWEDMDGYAFIDELSKELGKTLLPPGKEELLETASLSRWGGLRTTHWLKAQGLSEEAIRGLVCVHHSLLNQSGFDEVVKTVRERVLKYQTGEK